MAKDRPGVRVLNSIAEGGRGGKECAGSMSAVRRAQEGRGWGQLLPLVRGAGGAGPRWNAAEQGQESGEDSVAAARLRRLSLRP